MSSKSELQFLLSQEQEPHFNRTKEILRKHPEIKKLMGRNPYSFLGILGLVTCQIVLAWFCSTQPWWVLLLVAYFIGAFFNHSLFTLIHESSHNLIFKKKQLNIWAGILCDFPNGFPISVSFRKYHLMHHKHQGDEILDADLPSKWEARMVSNSTLGKAMWLLFFPIFQVARTSRIKVHFFDTYTIMNLLLMLAFDTLVVWLWGPAALIYLMLCFFFCLGLHPLGARWVQEHYLTSSPQETYSYYGILNKINFNIGHHNEHHDFMAVPWHNLPKVRKIAPEYYNTLKYHTSWTKLLFRFLFNKNISLFSRAVRVSGKKE